MSTSDATTGRTLDSNLFITVSGRSGTDVTTLCEGLSEALNCGYVSGGEVFREVADERDMSLTQLIAEASASETIDRDIDRRLRTVAEKWGASNKAFVLESRLAGWLAGNRADLRIRLDAPEEVRIERTADREEVGAEMRVRDVIDAKRYEDYYGVDITDRSIYDLCLNTARWSPEGVLELVLSAVEEYDPTTDEGAFRTEDLDV